MLAVTDDGSCVKLRFGLLGCILELVVAFAVAETLAVERSNRLAAPAALPPLCG